MNPRESDKYPPPDSSVTKQGNGGSLAQSLRAYTAARVGLRRAGATLATTEVLDFKLAHAQARDAVHAELDTGEFDARLRQQITRLSVAAVSTVTLKSAAPDRPAYLRRPDLGRQLDPDSASQLKALACDVVFVVGDGLSAAAVERHAIPLLSTVLPETIRKGWTYGPICIATQARVAIGDAIGAALGAKLSVILIGERPGLSTPDSLGVYLTWDPRPGRHDAERNCISNVGGAGLSYEIAAARLIWYMSEAMSRQGTGFALKEQSSPRLSGPGS